MLMYFLFSFEKSKMKLIYIVTIQTPSLHEVVTNKNHTHVLQNQPI